MGDRSYSHVLDGFGRLSKWHIKDGEVKMTSSLLECKWLDKCKKDNNLIPGVSFRETTPPRKVSKIPLVNIIYSVAFFDNNWVMPWRMPDQKTYVSMTDTPNMLKIDIDTL